MKLIIKLPSNTDLLINPSQTVDFNTPLLRKKTTQTKTVPLSTILKFEPNKIFMNLRKLVGEHLKPGDLIAEHKAVFATKQYFSEVTGIITEINHMTGSIVIETMSDNDNEMNCFFKGEVVSIADNRLELKVKKYKEFDIFPIKQYFGAEVFYIQPTSAPIITEEDVENKFICAEEIKGFEQVKLEALGAVGMISPPHDSLPPQKNDLIPVILKQKTDFSTILDLQYTFCRISETQNTIYFYE